MVVAMVAGLGVCAGRAGASEGLFAGLIQSIAGRQMLLLSVQAGKRAVGLLGSGAAVLLQHSTTERVVKGGPRYKALARQLAGVYVRRILLTR